MLGCLIQIDGWDPTNAQAVALRAGSHDHPSVCHLNGQTWWPVLTKLPTLRYDLFDGAFAGMIEAPSAQATLRVEPWPLFSRYALADARIRLWTGEVGDPWSEWTQRFDGRLTAQPKVAEAAAEIAFAVDDRWLDRALLSTYAGTTGAEGPAALKGVAKPLALGAPRYVPGVLVDPVNSVFQVNGYGAIQGVEAALERLMRFGAAFGNYADYGALVAAPVPPGRWATSLAQGLVRFGAPPSGLISFLLQGDVAGPNGWARKPGQIVRRIAQLAGASDKIDEASLDALDAARPYNLSIYLDAQTTSRELIQQIAASVNAVAVPSWMGKLMLLPVGLGTPTETLAADGSALPPVSSVEQLEVAAPFKKLALGSARTWAVHGLSDVAFTATLVDTGAYATGTTYREGNIVQHQGSTWLYINPTPSAGNAPPALPTESNSWWRVLARAGADGVSAYAVLLTNENHILPADADGNVTTYNGAITDVVIYSAGQDVSASFSLSIVDNPQVLSTSITGRRVTVTGGLDAGEQNATLTIRATGSGPMAGVVLDKVFGLTKSRAGADGVSPPLIDLSATSQVLHRTSAGAVADDQPAFVFTASRRNIVAGTTFSFAQGHSTAAPGISISGDTMTITPARMGAMIAYDEANNLGGASVKIVASAGGLSDTVTVVGVNDGADGAPGTSAITAYLTNESHTVPATAANDPITYVGAAFAVVVLSGSTDVTSLFTAAEAPGGNPQGLTFTGAYPNYQLSNGFDAAESAATYTLRITGSGLFAGVTLDRTFSLSKSRAGAAGTSPPLVTVSAAPQAVRYGPDDQIASGDIVFTAQRQNTAQPVVWSSAAGHPITGVAGVTVNGDTLTISAARMASVLGFNQGQTGRATETIIATVGSVSDRVTVTKVKDGSDGQPGASALQIMLTNEAVVLPATAAGDLITYAGASTTIVVLAGTTDVTSSFSAVDLVAGDGRNPQGLSVAGTYPNYSVNGGFDQGESVASFLFKVQGKAGTPYVGVVLTKTMTLTKSRAAADGTSPVLVSLSASPQAVSFDETGAIASGPVTIRAMRQNTASPVVWSSGYGHAVTGIAGVTINGDTMTIEPGRIAEVLNSNRVNYGVDYEVIIATVGGVSDRVTLTKVQDGVPGDDAYALEVSVSAFVVACDYLGNAKAGALPLPFTVKVTRGSADVTASATIAYSSSAGVQIASGSASSNALTGVGAADGYLNVHVTIAGVTFPPRRLPILKDADQPPPSNVQGTSRRLVAIVVTEAFDNSNATAEAAVLTAPPGGAVTFTYTGTYFAPSDTGTIQRVTVQGKVQYRSGGGGWLDAPGLSNGGTAIYVPGDGPEPASIGVTGMLSGLTPGTNYEWRFIGRLIAPRTGSAITTVTGDMIVKQP